MSPRAAWRLASLDFTRVFDYEAGKTDWTAYGLPTEGDNSATPRPGTIAITDVPTCRLDESIGDVRSRLGDSKPLLCIVTTDAGIVLGRLRDKEFKSDPSERVADVMEPGPTTVRFDEYLPDLTQRMVERNVATIVVTTPGGHLIGVMRREDAAAALLEWHSHGHHH
jgi:CBS domain-containing protein